MGSLLHVSPQLSENATWVLSVDLSARVGRVFLADMPSPSPRSLLGTAHLSSGFGTPRTPMVEEVGHKVPFSGGGSGHGAPTTSPRLSREFCLVVVVRVCL